MENRASKWRGFNQQDLSFVPRHVREVATAFGSDYDVAEPPLEEVKNLLYTPDKLTREAVDGAWERVNRAAEGLAQAKSTG